MSTRTTTVTLLRLWPLEIHCFVYTLQSTRVDDHCFGFDSRKGDTGSTLDRYRLTTFPCLVHFTICNCFYFPFSVEWIGSTGAHITIIMSLIPRRALFPLWVLFFKDLQLIGWILQ